MEIRIFLSFIVSLTHINQLKHFIIRKLVFAALAGVFMLSSGFSVVDNSIESKNPTNLLEFVDIMNVDLDNSEVSVEYIRTICRYTFKNSEGEVTAVVEFDKKEGVSCSDSGQIAQARRIRNLMR